MNNLPTLVNLRIKRLTNKAVYPRCMQGLENKEHIFCDYAVTKKTWDKLNYAWPQELSQLEFLDWFTWIMLNSEKDVCRAYVCAIWAI